MILIHCVILLLHGLCNAQIRDGAHLNLISNKVEALEKIVTSLENSISKLEVSLPRRTQFVLQTVHKFNAPFSYFRRKISNQRKKLIPRMSKKMFQIFLRDRLNSLSVLKHQKSPWAHRTRLVKGTEFKLNYYSHKVNKKRLFFQQ